MKDWVRDKHPLYFLRRDREITRKTLAHEIVGCSITTIFNIELRNTGFLALEQWRAYAAALGMSLDQFNNLMLATTHNRRVHNAENRGRTRSRTNPETQAQNDSVSRSRVERSKKAS